MADIGYKLEIGKYMLYGKSLDCKHGSLQTEQESFSALLHDKEAFRDFGLKRMNFSKTVIGLHHTCLLQPRDFGQQCS